MTIKAGQLITTGDNVLVQRLQTGGPNNINIPSTRINELGNYLAVAVSHDTPDLTFSMESFDMSCATEALLVKKSGSAGPYPISTPSPIDVCSEWLAGQETGASQFNVVESVAIPYLMVDSLSYRIGLTDMAQKTISLRGDSIFYCPGTAVVQNFTASGTSAQACLLTNVAGIYNGDTTSGPRRSLNVTVGTTRLVFGVDYTESYTGSGAFQTTTVTIINAQLAGATIAITYFTSVATTFLQAVHTAPATLPAALRGRDITILLNGKLITNRMTGIQSAQVDARFSVTRNEELGNSFATSIDFLQAPDVTGNFVARCINPADLHSRLKAMMNVALSTEAIGPSTFFENRLDIMFHNPASGAVLEILEIPDAVITIPPFSGRVNQPLDIQFSFMSDSGTIVAYDNVSELP